MIPPLSDFAGCLVLLTSLTHDPVGGLSGTRYFHAEGTITAEIGVFSGKRYGEHGPVFISNLRPVQRLRKRLDEGDAGPFVGWVTKRDAPEPYGFQIVFEWADAATTDSVLRAAHLIAL